MYAKQIKECKELLKRIMNEEVFEEYRENNYYTIPLVEIEQKSELEKNLFWNSMRRNVEKWGINLNLIKFINNNSKWESVLQEKPYCLKITRKNNFIMFNYNMIESDFYNPIVKECRGIILEDITFRPVCVPFFKFANYGEGYSDNINWNTARIQEKVDGSLIKVWSYKNQWYVSTNGMIDANDACLNTDICEYKTFYDLFKVASNNSGLDLKLLNKDFTYMFELISPFNKIVIPYNETKIIHIGTRDNFTLKEIDIDLNIQKPKNYEFKSIEDCVEIAKKLPFNQEGYVIVDNDWNRVKIKSPSYVAVHHLKNNGIINKQRAIELIKKNEHHEFLIYFPEFAEFFNTLENKYIKFIEDMDFCIECAKNDKKLDNRKKFAEFAKTTRCPAMMFNWLDGKFISIKEWINSQMNEKIIYYIGA